MCLYVHPFVYLYHHPVGVFSALFQFELNVWKRIYTYLIDIRLLFFLSLSLSLSVSVSELNVS